MAEGEKRSFDERLSHLVVIEKMLLNGLKQRHIYTQFGKDAGISYQALTRDIAIIRARWRKNLARIQKVPGDQLAEAIERREADRRNAIQKEDYDLAFKVEQDRCRLLDIYPDKKGTPHSPREHTEEDMADDQLIVIASNDNSAASGTGTPETPKSS